MLFYVAITTIRKYKCALDMMIASIPPEWAYIIVYQDEPEEGYQIFADGHFEVYITNNLSDYGNWIGVYMLLEKDLIPRSTWFLFVHDTCKFLDGAAELTPKIVNEYHDTDVELLWLCNIGQCNICLIRGMAIEIGNSLYKNIPNFTKMETIELERNFTHPLSPKSFDVIQEFLQVPPIELGRRCVYHDKFARSVLLFRSIGMEKYYFFILKEEEHPRLP